MQASHPDTDMGLLADHRVALTLNRRKSCCQCAMPTLVTHISIIAVVLTKSMQEYDCRSMFIRWRYDGRSSYAKCSHAPTFY